MSAFRKYIGQCELNKSWFDDNLHVLFAWAPAGEFTLLVQEVQHTAKDGQQEDANDDDRNDHATAL